LPENSSLSSLSPSSSYSQSNDDQLHKPGSDKHSFSSGHPPRTPSDTPQHLDTVSKKDTVDSIKNDNKQDNLKKNDKTDDSENGKA